MTPKISVIIPIYNTAQYLDKCLQSVLQQTLKDIEIICVDDCSPDDSYLIVEKYIDLDPRVSLIRHKKNTESGGARNTGILAAKADFLASVDSDDSMHPEMLKTLWDASDNGNFDVVCCGYDCIDEEGNKLNSKIFTPQSFNNENNSIDIFSMMNPAFWNKLWRKSLYIDNNIFFPEKVYYQDLATTPRILAKSSSIKLIDASLYCYLVRVGSVTTTYSPKHIIDYFRVFEILLDFLETNNLVEYYREDFIDYVKTHILLHAKNIFSSDKCAEEKTQYLQYLLLFRDSFLDNFKLIKTKKLNELIDLLKPSNVPSTYKHKYESANKQLFRQSELMKKLEFELKSYKGELELLKQKDNGRLFLYQKLGVFLFGVITKPTLTRNQSLKLRNNPRGFFKDSKSKLARKYASLFRLNVPLSYSLDKKIYQALYDLALNNQESIRSHTYSNPWDLIDEFKTFDCCLYSQNMDIFSHIRGALKGSQVTCINEPNWGGGEAFLTWGNMLRNSDNTKSMDVVNSILNEHKPIFIVEDGFLRSVVSFANKDVPERYQQSYSMVVDDLAPYYSAYQNTRLEQMLNNFDEGSMDLDYVLVLINKILDSYLSKYNNQPLLDLESKVKNGVLVIDQVGHDYSVVRGGGKANLQKMLQTAIDENPGKNIFLKIHPDNITNESNQNGFYGEIIQNKNVFLIDYECNSIALMKHVEKVYVFSSQLGFEAILLGKNVQVFGLPFYIGWGFSQDRHPHAKAGRFKESRVNRLSKEGVFYVAYCLYSKYLDRKRNATTIDKVIDILIEERKHYFKKYKITDELGVIES